MADESPALEDKIDVLAGVLYDFAMDTKNAENPQIRLKVFGELVGWMKVKNAAAARDPEPPNELERYQNALVQPRSPEPDPAPRSKHPGQSAFRGNGGTPAVIEPEPGDEGDAIAAIIGTLPTLDGGAAGHRNGVGRTLRSDAVSDRGVLSHADELSNG